MTDHFDPDQRDRMEAAINLAADQAALTIAALQATGLPLPLILVGFHAETVSALAAVMGGDAAAGCCQRAAARVAGLPPVCDLTAMDDRATHTAGRA
jgi:hypothetical protein